MMWLIVLLTIYVSNYGFYVLKYVHHKTSFVMFSFGLDDRVWDFANIYYFCIQESAARLFLEYSLYQPSSNLYILSVFRCFFAYTN